ncbi:MAG TPA: hypothetical protein VMY37_02310, partial [Thermoguttaceae bacterium]|nr:hypothetical protein [Thermoguttaceae bacterium]
MTRRYAQKLLTKIKCSLRVWHRREQMPAEKWRRAADRARRAVSQRSQRARRAPQRSEAQNIA